MSLSEKAIKEFQKIYKKEYGKEISYEEARDSGERLVDLYKIMFDSHIEELKLKEKLKDHPKGFSLMDGKTYNCGICHASIKDEQLWYDKWGIKCPLCQKAINKKIIPGSVAKNKDSWYSEFDLKDRFNIDKQVMKEFVKKGILKPRIVSKNTGQPHEYVFMIKDNKDTLPPKKLTESEHISYKGDEKGVVHVEPWYKFVDPYKHLEHYKIVNYLQIKNK